jgi:hypothetical protein
MNEFLFNRKGEKTMKRNRSVGNSIAAALVALLLLPWAVGAEEGGAGHYMPGGAASFIDTLLGKPGVAVANFFTFYDAGASVSRPIPIAGTITADIDATAYLNTIAVIYQTPLKVLGGYYAVGAALPFGHMSVDGTVTAGGATGARSDSVFGVADLLIYPFMLGWTALDDQLKYDVRLGVYAPTGDFDVGELANLGKNYWTFEPAASISFISKKIGLETTAFAGFDVNTKNDETDYQSGAVFHLDVTVAEHLPIFKGRGGIIGVGANVFYYQQFTGDGGSGAVLGDFQGRTLGVGPVLSYIRPIGKLTFATEAKWLPELNVAKRLKGDIVWFKVAVIF